MLRFDRRLLLNVDWILVVTAAFIIALSVLSLWSLAPGRGGGALAWRQLSWVWLANQVGGLLDTVEAPTDGRAIDARRAAADWVAGVFEQPFLLSLQG